MEAGAKAIIAQQAVNPISETQDSITNEWFEDSLANFNYRYDEQIYSVYGIFGQQIGKEEALGRRIINDKYFLYRHIISP